MSTPRERGLVDSAYAVEAAARAFGDAHVLDLARELTRDVQGMTVPLFQASGLMDRAALIGALLASRTGSNPLDRDDLTPWAGVETPDRAAFSSGDLDANVYAFGSDLAASAREAADAAAPFALAGLAGLAVAAVAAFFLYKAVKS